jgi:hypothetical protein
LVVRRFVCLKHRGKSLFFVVRGVKNSPQEKHLLLGYWITCQNGQITKEKQKKKFLGVIFPLQPFVDSSSSFSSLAVFISLPESVVGAGVVTAKGHNSGGLSFVAIKWATVRAGKKKV